MDNSLEEGAMTLQYVFAAVNAQEKNEYEAARARATQTKKKLLEKGISAPFPDILREEIRNSLKMPAEVNYPLISQAAIYDGHVSLINPDLVTANLRSQAGRFIFQDISARVKSLAQDPRRTYD